MNKSHSEFSFLDAFWGILYISTGVSFQWIALLFVDLDKIQRPSGLFGLFLIFISGYFLAQVFIKFISYVLSKSGRAPQKRDELSPPSNQ
jgi:hypothetical protein